jgi:EAL domain-containing protein (putative c-di-GMP-specific phosphodiesterase class I)
MSVNVSAGDLAQAAFVARVSRAIIEAGLRPEHLTLELTEGILMSQIGGAMDTLAALKRLGVRLAVDDFGTGYSSLSHLSKLPIDSLKIDRSFVGALRPGSDEAAVVRAIIQLGAALRKSVVAEGIESADQMELLRTMGCELGQGFHLGTPLSTLQAGELLRAQPPATLH